MKDKLSEYAFIDIRELLSEDDYYRTDLHWEQQKITDVANAILESMGEAGRIDTSNYKEKTFDDFRGAYYGQAALPIVPDKLVYLTNKTLENCKVFDYEYNKYLLRFC